MRPKANYIVKRIGDDKLVIKGGYGRQFTNFYNVYSYMRYIFDTNSNTLTVQKTKRHINSLQSPIENKKQGLF